jgi:hypothetical protein
MQFPFLLAITVNWTHIMIKSKYVSMPRLPQNKMVALVQRSVTSGIHHSRFMFSQKEYVGMKRKSSHFSLSWYTDLSYFQPPKAILRTVLWVATPSKWERGLCFGVTELAACSFWFLAWLPVWPWWCRQCAPPKWQAVLKLQSSTTQKMILFTATAGYSILKNGVFWDVTLCGPCKNRRFGGTWRLLYQGDKNRWTRNNASCN